MNGDNCSCWTDPSTWFYYGGIPEPGSQCEWDPDCPEHPCTHPAHGSGADHVCYFRPLAAKFGLVDGQVTNP